MFRKALLPILCAATFAAAIPLKMGESWVWQVSDRSSTFVTYRSARVVDSHAVDLGKIWTLVARDSTDGSQDTAKILVIPSGRQMWLRASSLLLWELEPYREPDTSYVMAEGDTARVWGETSVGEFDFRPSPLLSEKPRLLVSETGISFQSMIHLSFEQSLPIHRWSDSLGLERALTFVFRPGQVRNHPLSWDWRLVSHNGQKIDLEHDSVFLPEVGTRLVWALSQNGIRSSLEWTLREVLPDSMDWNRLRIAAKKVTCQRTLLITTANPKGSFVDSPCVDTSRWSIDVRINSLTGQAISTDTLGPQPELGWIRRWEDSLWRDTTIPSVFHFREVSNYGISTTTGLHSELHRRNGQLSHWLFYRVNAASPVAFTPLRPTYDSSWTTMDLLKVIPPGPDSSGTGIRVHTPPLAPSSLAQIVAQHPSLPMRWSTASGRNGTLTASEIVQRPATLRGKTIFLQARLPDGRTWQGTHVVP